MTPAPVTVKPRQTLAEAHAVMRARRIHHLPVVDGEKLVGIVSQRDLMIIESLPGVDAAEVPVEDAMTKDVFVVAPGASSPPSPATWPTAGSDRRSSWTRNGWSGSSPSPTPAVRSRDCFPGRGAGPASDGDRPMTSGLRNPERLADHRAAVEAEQKAQRMPADAGD
jgi:hypothetical protein